MSTEVHYVPCGDVMKYNNAKTAEYALKIFC